MTTAGGRRNLLTRENASRPHGLDRRKGLHTAEATGSRPVSPTGKVLVGVIGTILTASVTASRDAIAASVGDMGCTSAVGATTGASSSTSAEVPRRASSTT